MYLLYVVWLSLNSFEARFNPSCDEMDGKTYDDAQQGAAYHVAWVVFSQIGTAIADEQGPQNKRDSNNPFVFYFNRTFAEGVSGNEKSD